jgi:hypothetical protein
VLNRLVRPGCFLRCVETSVLPLLPALYSSPSTCLSSGFISGSVGSSVRRYAALGPILQLFIGSRPATPGRLMNLHTLNILVQPLLTGLILAFLVRLGLE